MINGEIVTSSSLDQILSNISPPTTVNIPKLFNYYRLNSLFGL